MATEGGFTIRPHLPQTEEQQQQARADRLREEREERERRIALYQSFKNSPLNPNCARVYYPGCGSDDALAEAFPKSEVHLVDIKKESIDELQSKHLSPNVHAVEASITDYDPGPVDVLVVHGTDFDMRIDKAINVVKNGGFVLSGDDAATGLRDELLHRPDLEFAGILRSVEEPDAETVARVQQETRRGVAGVAPEFRFEEGRREHAELVETDEEFQRAHPALFRYVQSQWEMAKAHYKNQSVPESILAFAKTIRSVPIPPKQPGAALWIFRKLSRDVQSDSATNDRVRFLEGAQIPTTETQTQTLISEANARHLQDFLKLDGLKQMNPLEVAWCLVLHKHPELAEVVREQDTSSRFDGGSIVCPTSEEEALKITFNDLDLSVIEELMQHRPKSAALVAEQLGIPREELSPLLLKTFIFLHELGHANDYLLNFLKPLQDAQDALPKTRATASWRAKFQVDMAALPIPNINPSRLRMFSMFAPLPELAKQNGAHEEIVRLAEHDPEAVLQKQEEAYKNSDSEQRADQFATTMLRQHILMNQ